MVTKFFYRDFNTSYVVIKRSKGVAWRTVYHISIHLMLLLNIVYCFPFSILINISIHLMLLLNVMQERLELVLTQNFNTSYVVIKRKSDTISRCYLYISIHLMLLLNRRRLRMYSVIKDDFNTSYVVIKHF